MGRVRVALVLGAVVLLFAVAITWQHMAAAPTLQQDDNAPDALWQRVAAMPLSEQVGQLVIAGLDGSTLNAQAERLIADYHVGGFILYETNIKNSGQLLDLLDDLKSASSSSGTGVPLFLSVDEEGGRVSRMPAEFVKLPANKVIGAANDSELSFTTGQVISRELKAFGFNMDFAPVLDINSNPRNPVIGDRSFGADSDVVSRLGVATMKGLQAGGIIPVVKHFPGHGDTSVDSHVDLPVVDKGLDQLQDFELVPFSKAITGGADAVMVAHILVRKVDPQHPASLSSAVMSDLLRKRLGFDGVIITDDLTMGAITNTYGLGSAAVQAVLAGADVVLVAHGYDQAVTALEALQEAVRSGEVPESRVRESVYRVLKLKEKYHLSDEPMGAVDVNSINDELRAVVNDIKQYQPR